MKAITADKTGEGENSKQTFLQSHTSASFEEIVNPIYCQAGKHLVYKQAEKKSMGEKKTLPYSMAIERPLVAKWFYLFNVVIFRVSKFSGFAWVIEEEASEAEIWLVVNRAVLNLSTESV